VVKVAVLTFSASIAEPTGYAETVRTFAIAVAVIAAILMTGCDSSPAPSAPQDGTPDAAYNRSAEQLAGLARAANEAFRNHKPDDAAALIEQGEAISEQLLSALHPTLAATEAASDLDDLYGRMLLSNKHYVWAQSMFQKNFARWKYWKPQTADTARRMKEASDGVDECERLMAK
jgi:outer membrane PBP1 activator LpoA protein